MNILRLFFKCSRLTFVFVSSSIFWQDFLERSKDASRISYVRNKDAGGSDGVLDRLKDFVHLISAVAVWYQW